MKTETPKIIRCPLCGFEFEKSATPCHQGCPMNAYCNLTCCPNCRYEFPEEKESFGWVKRLFGRKATACTQSAVMSLTALEVGQTGEVVSLNSRQGNRRNALAVFGLVPGSWFTLQQKSPAYVIRIGETELALEPAIAREILVKRV
jgi:Fe2+ transport system protein FeoA